MNAKTRALLFYWGPVVLYMAAIYTGSSVSTVPDMPAGVTDKMLHFGEYALLGLLLARALAGPRWLPGRRGLLRL